jgi:hypothetical protein
MLQSILVIVAFLGLILLTLGVAYLTWVDFRDRQRAKNSKR